MPALGPRRSRQSAHGPNQTLGVVQNAEGWMGEGDEMIFVDDLSKPLIIGTPLAARIPMMRPS